MKVLWTFLKVVAVLVLVVPVTIIVLGAALGILGALVGVAFAVLRLAIIGLIGYGIFRLGLAILRPRARPEPPAIPKPLPPADRHYEAALRELDDELGETRR